MSMATLQDTLHRIPELMLEMDGSGNVTVHHEGRRLVFGPEALCLLDVFTGGRTIGEAIQQLASRLSGRRALEAILTCALQMREAGILSVDGQAGFSEQTFPRGGYDAAYVHIRMLNDAQRKQAFIDAIREVVRPDDVVLDLGTGSGILAVAAAQAGARQVYAVEPSSIIRLAERVAAVNGVANRIAFLRGWSSHIELPEKATVLTTDIIGNESLEMRLWETLADARERLLTPDARMIPESVVTRVALVEAPASLLRQYRPDGEHLAVWREAYGMDFSPLVEDARGRRMGFYIEPHLAAPWPVLSKAETVYEIDLSRPPKPFITNGILTADRAGTANALLSYFEARLSDSVTLITAPWQGSENSHWYCFCAALAAPRVVAEGDQLAFRYEYWGEGRSLYMPLDAVES